MEEHIPELENCIIYEIFCEISQKSYIGQSEHSLETRINGHFKASKYKFTEGCLALNAALRKYGRDAFIYTVVLNCKKSEMDFYEIYFIAEYNSLAPNGYNLHGGGKTPIIMSEESKMRHSQNRREYFKDQKLPIFVQHLKTKYGEGYIYYRSGYLRAQFCSMKLTMNQKRELATEYAKNPLPKDGRRHGKISYIVNSDGTVNVKMPN
jgi:group I intron endonuclease